MENTAYLYLMLSRTGTGMGKVIRLFTRSEYNHVSLTLDDSLHSFVSFARYAEDVPLAGGFVLESAERFLCCGHEVPVRIFRVELSRQRHRQLEELFSLAGDRQSGPIYNSLGALFTTWGIRCPIPGAYTCLEFAGIVLGKSFRSLQELEKQLAPCEIYRGDLLDQVTDSGLRLDPYFVRRGFLRGTQDTIVHFAKLLARLLRLNRRSDPIVTLLE